MRGGGGGWAPIFRQRGAPAWLGGKVQGKAGTMSDLAVDFQRDLVALRHMLGDG